MFVWDGFRTFKDACGRDRSNVKPCIARLDWVHTTPVKSACEFTT